VNGDAIFAVGSLGGAYFFSLRDIAPFVGADFGYGATKVESDSVFSGESRGGFALGVSAGVMLLRTSAVNLEIAVKTSFLLAANANGAPQAYSLRLGLYF
jgi:hypothetical protein